MACRQIRATVRAPNTGPHHCTRETRALFICPVYQREGVMGLDVVFVQCAEDF